MCVIQEQAPAKINLALKVIGKMEDGYHSIDTVFHEISLSDKVTLENRDDGAIVIECNHYAVPLGKTNIAYKAAQLLRSQYKVDKGVTITLQKNIPVAAGLAGGSSNAAAVLRALPRLWDIEVSPSMLLALGRQLGADVAFCLTGGTQRGTARGDVLTPVFNNCRFWVAVMPQKLMVSTADVYHRWNAQFSSSGNVDSITTALQRGDFDMLTDCIFNDLERVTIAMYPELAEKLTLLRKNDIACLMSGSGPTLFALLKQPEQVDIIRSLLPQQDVELCRQV